MSRFPQVTAREEMPGNPSAYQEEVWKEYIDPQERKVREAKGRLEWFMREDPADAPRPDPEAGERLYHELSAIKRNMPHTDSGELAGRIMREMAPREDTGGDWDLSGEMVARSYVGLLKERHGNAETTFEQRVAAYGAVTEKTLGFTPTLAHVTSWAILARMGNIFQREVASRSLGLAMCLPETVERTTVTYRGPTGGVAIPELLNPSIIDRHRAEFGVWSMPEWIPIRGPGNTLRVVIIHEPSTARPSRGGGAITYSNLPEDATTVASDGALDEVNLVLRNIRFATTLSRDLWADSSLIEPYIGYLSKTVVRQCIESELLSGGLYEQGYSVFQPLYNHSATVVVTKGATAGGSVTALNVDSMYSALPGASRQTAYWFMNSATFGKLTALAATNAQEPLVNTKITDSGYPEIYQRPVIVSDFCQAAGTQGDVIFADVARSYKIAYKDFVLSIESPKDDDHSGSFGLPDGSIEIRASDHYYYSTDVVAVLVKARLAGGANVTTTWTDPQGSTFGFASVIESR